MAFSFVSATLSAGDPNRRRPNRGGVNGLPIPISETALIPIFDALRTMATPGVSSSVVSETSQKTGARSSRP